MSKTLRFLSRKEVLSLIPVSRATLARWEKAGKFPQGRKLSHHRNGKVGYPDCEVRDWQLDRLD